nr:MAG TPA: hypothetical protein [Caudoviricetes sp.]
MLIIVFSSLFDYRCGYLLFITPATLLNRSELFHCQT